MNTKLPISAPPLGAPLMAPVRYERLGFGWGAVLAGLTAAVGLNVLFAELGLALNLGLIDRETNGGAIAAANGVAWVVAGLVALFTGAWVAGRIASARTRLEGALHGLAVWGAGSVVMLVLAFTAAGVLGGGMLTLVGKGLESAGAVLQTAAPKWNEIKAELESAMDTRLASASVDSSGTQTQVSGVGASGASAEDRLIDRSRLFDLADRHFSVDGRALATGEREELVLLIAGQTGISRDAAERTLAQWDGVWARSVEAYETAKREAAALAEKARVTAIAAASWAAAAMVFGAAAALSGGAYGTRCRLQALERERLHLGHSTPLRPAQLRDDAFSRGAPHPLV
jgi:hypothetical protein